VKCCFHPSITCATACASLTASFLASPYICDSDSAVGDSSSRLLAPRRASAESRAACPEGSTSNAGESSYCCASVHEQRMILLVIVSVVDQNVEHHPAKHLAHLCGVGIAVGHPSTTQQLCQFRVSEAFARGAQRRAGGIGCAGADHRSGSKRLMATACRASGVRASSARCGYRPSAPVSSLRARSVVYPRGPPSAKLDDPLLARNLDQRFGSSAAHGQAWREQALLRRRDRLVVLHFADQLLELIRILECG